MKKVGKREKRNSAVYNAIVDYSTKNLYPPTIEEIMGLTGIKGKQSIVYAMEDLKAAELIDFNKGARRITLVGYRLVKE